MKNGPKHKRKPAPVPERAKPNVSLARRFWPLLLLPFAGVVAYWNSFDVPFVFDDFVTIQSNSSIQFGDLLKLPANLWTRTLLYMTFAANYAAGGQSVWGYHLVNLLLHLLNGLLIYFLARQIFKNSGRGDTADAFGLLAALFFLVHPIQTESVTYISSRSELLSTLFFILGVLLFVRRRPDQIGFSFSLVIAAILALALGAKETAISLPAALLLYDFIFLSSGNIRKVFDRWRFHATFLTGSLAAAFYLAFFGNLRSSIGTVAAGISPYSYFLTQLRVLVRYVQITLFPVGLNLAYDFRISQSPIEPQVILSGLVLLGLVGLAFWLRKRQPILAFSILWFFVTLAPTSSFFPINDVIFEHRLYLPMVGLCLSFPIAVELILVALQRGGARKEAAIAGAAILVALVIGTVMRNEVWRDEARLWSDVVGKSPDSSRGYAGLAWAYYKRGEYEKALEVTKVGLTTARNNPEVRENQFKFYSNMGQLYFELGRYEESVDALSQVLKWNLPAADRARTYYNIAVAYLAELSRLNINDKEKVAPLAEDALVRSIASDNNFLPAWDSYINLSTDRGTADIARQKLQEQLTTNPAIGLYGLGKLAFQERNYREAVNFFMQAEKYFAQEKMFLFNYAYALEEIGNVDAALDKYIAATRVDPLFIQAHYNLGQIYVNRHLEQAAVEHFEQILRIDAKNAPARLQLARIFIQQGQLAAARDYVSAVLRESPSNAEAQALWQQVRQN